jgi:hypothetical protein
VGYPLDAAHYDGETGAALVNPFRSYVLNRWRRSDGVLEFIQSYDVYGNGAGTGGRGAAHLTADLNALTSAHIFALNTYDEPFNLRLTAGLPAAIYRNGGTPGKFESSNWTARGAYMLIGIGGCGPGMAAFEAYAGTGTDTGGDGPDNAWIDTTFQIIAGNIVVGGAGLAGFGLNAGNVSTYIADAAIGAAQIGSLSVGVMSTAMNGGASSGARVEMAGNVIRVFDSSNVLRVKIGNLA